MMRDSELSKELLYAGNYTCVLQKSCDVHTSTLRGVKPLVLWLQSGTDFKEYSAADKVVGKATAFLYVLLGVKSVYAGVISRSALSVLQKYRIPVEYDILTENIINRNGDGICPFEAAVLSVEEPEAAYSLIRKKMLEMNITL